jgi:ABC-2 type transport system ATP-binding protein
MDITIRLDITIRHLTKVYRGGVHALDDVNLTIPHGVFGLLGPNGAGKTTLMRLLAGVLLPTSGTIHVGEYDAASEPGRRAIKQMLGYLPQELALYPDLTARGFLDYIGILKGLHDKKSRQQRVNSLLEMVALSDVAQRKLKTFSGGMKRRVGIAQALLNNPTLLIVDEPTAGLDPEERIHFRNLLSDLAGGRTVLLSTHIIEDIAQTSQNLAVVKGGRVIFQGTIARMISETRGHVWIVTSRGARPVGDVAIVSTLNMGEAIRYRVVSEQRPQPDAEAVEPTLEDCYAWLMHVLRTSVTIHQKGC